jgi:hypothetical protein
MLDAVDLKHRVPRLAAGDGDLTTVRTALDRLLRMAVGHDVAALSTVDPATNLWTSCFVSGIPAEGGAERERVIYDIEFRGEDVNGYGALAAAPVPIGRLHSATGGDITRAQRWRPLLEPLGIADEMRVMLRSQGACWGSLTLYRRVPAEPFTERDAAVVADAVTAMADLFRLTLLRAALAAPGGVEQPPGLLVVGPDGEVASTSATAAVWLEAIDDRGRVPSAVRAVAAAGELVATLHDRHYEPRRDAGATPSPYGWYLDDAI